MTKDKKTKMTRKKEFYINRIVRDNEEKDNNDSNPLEEVKEDSKIYNETIGYHRDPSYYDNIRGKKVAKPQEPRKEVAPRVESKINDNHGSDDILDQAPNENEYEDELYTETNIDEVVEIASRPTIIPRSSDKPQNVTPKVEKRPLVEEKPNKVVNEIRNNKKKRKYIPPKLEFLSHDTNSRDDDIQEAERQKAIINQTLEEANIHASVAKYIFGPTVTQFLIKVDPGVNVKVISSCECNLAMYLEAEQIRIQTPIPGKSFAGIEVPRRPDKRRNVCLGDMLGTKEFKNTTMNLPVAIGQDNYGGYMYIDITEMPHGLVAGTTKSGKSVCLNSILISLLYKFSPEELRVVLIDPKRIELGIYAGIPHLAMPVITNQEDFPSALTWIFDEMERRYMIFESYEDRDIQELNRSLQSENKPKLPYILVIMDEFSDWISGAGVEIEKMLQRIAQKARAAGINIILAAQRPSKDVIKGSIKANFDTRIAFKVASFDDAKVILGGSGAEKLEGRGDMLIRYAGQTEKRLQGAYVSNGDIKKVINYLKEYNEVDYLVTKEELKQSIPQGKVEGRGQGRYDERFEELAYYIVRNKSGSNNQIMQVFGMGYNRVNDIFIALEELGVVGPAVKGKPRDVLIDEFQLTDILESEE